MGLDSFDRLYDHVSMGKCRCSATHTSMMFVMKKCGVRGGMEVALRCSLLCIMSVAFWNLRVAFEHLDYENNSDLWVYKLDRILIVSWTRQSNRSFLTTIATGTGKQMILDMLPLHCPRHFHIPILAISKHRKSCSHSRWSLSYGFQP